MALKAGRVGVHPSQVDRSGKVIGGGSEGYSKAEADAKFATKEELEDYVEVEDYTADLAEINTALSGKADADAVTEALAAKADTDAVTTALAAKADTTALALKADQSNLTANDNNFIFAYDSTSQKYGYKAGGADTFHPFSSGGGLTPIFEEKTTPSASGTTAVTEDITIDSDDYSMLNMVQIHNPSTSSSQIRFLHFELEDGVAVNPTMYTVTTNSKVTTFTQATNNYFSATLDKANHKITLSFKTTSGTSANNKYLLEVY